MQDPLCEDCKARGLVVPATVAHHVVEVTQSEKLRLDLRNLVSVCEPCHSRLHASRRGGGG